MACQRVLSGGEGSPCRFRAESAQQPPLAKPPGFGELSVVMKCLQMGTYFGL